MGLVCNVDQAPNLLVGRTIRAKFTGSAMWLGLSKGVPQIDYVSSRSWGATLVRLGPLASSFGRVFLGIFDSEHHWSTSI